MSTGRVGGVQEIFLFGVRIRVCDIGVGCVYGPGRGHGPHKKGPSMNDKPATEVDAADQFPPATAYVVPDGPKALRETLCMAQAGLALCDDPRQTEHILRLGRLIAECDRHRPIGPDGKHGDRHTPTCGCPDKLPPGLEEAIDAAYADGSIFSENRKDPK